MDNGRIRMEVGGAGSPKLNSNTWPSHVSTFGHEV